jgi:hypothetical protein
MKLSGWTCDLWLLITVGPVSLHGLAKLAARRDGVATFALLDVFTPESKQGPYRTPSIAKEHACLRQIPSTSPKPCSAAQMP